MSTLQLAPRLFTVSQEVPQPPQFEVVVGVSQPSVSGAVVLQSACCGWHPVYWQVTPSQLAPRLLAVSQTLPQPPQFDVVVASVSQPSASGAALLQSTRPATHDV